MNRGDGGDNVLFAEGGIVVSQTRFVSRGDTYAMSSVSSCRTRYTDEQDGTKNFLRTLAILGSVVLGVVIWLMLDQIIVGGVIGIAGAIASVALIKTKYRLWHIYLGTVSGETRAVHSRDQDFILRVERAVNDAIVARG